jgi:hypothetical protein
MRTESLDKLGYPGYSIQEDAWLINAHGRMIGGSLNRQVRLQRPDQDPQWVAIAWLVATVFVPNPYGYFYVSYKDGNSSNMNAWNLGWSPTKHTPAHKKNEILKLLVDGLDVYEVAKAVRSNVGYVRTIAAERLRELERADKLMQRIENPE